MGRKPNQSTFFGVCGYLIKLSEATLRHTEQTTVTLTLQKLLQNKPVKRLWLEGFDRMSVRAKKEPA